MGVRTDDVREGTVRKERRDVAEALDRLGDVLAPLRVYGTMDPEGRPDPSGHEVAFVRREELLHEVETSLRIANRDGHPNVVLLIGRRVGLAQQPIDLLEILLESPDDAVHERTMAAGADQPL